MGLKKGIMAKIWQIKDKYGKIGYENKDTNEVIFPPQFDGGMYSFGSDSFSGVPYASVLLNSKCGIINEVGDIVVPIEFEEAYYLFGDLFAVRKKTDIGDWVFGVINVAGEYVIPFEYKLIEKGNGFIKCYKNASSMKVYNIWEEDQITYEGRIYNYKNLQGLFWLNSEGNVVYEGNVVENVHNILIIEHFGKLGVINQFSNIMLDTKYDEIHCPCLNRFIVRQNISENEWLFGVLDENQNYIVDCGYKYIESENGSFYQCYKEADSKFLTYKSVNNNYEYSNLNEEIWLNTNGEKIISGEATILSNEFLCVEKNGKQGVYNQKGKRIVNYIYDEIQEVDGKLAVTKDGKVGILGENGEIIIDTSYKRIECVHIASISDGLTYGAYSSEHPFDSSSEKSIFYKREIKKGWRLDVNKNFFFETDMVFILENDVYSELFTMEDGILPNSRFDSISTLNDIDFAVRNKGKWGVYCTNIKQVLIPCEYDRVIYEGKRTVLLNKNGLWGAKSLTLHSSNIFSSVMHADIPLKFHEIKILDTLEMFYSVKCEEKNIIGEISCYYTIVNGRGEEAFEMHCLHGQSHFSFYSLERVLSFNGEKYGFVNMYSGYISIPFKYDQVQKRNDGMFDVCINGAWGVLDINGKEIVQVKYSEKIPEKYNRLIIKEKTTSCFGIIDETGKEYVPTIYEHLMFSSDSNIIFFGYRGYERDESNFFSDEISSAIWGCLDNQGKCIIEAQYDCFKIQGNFILGGRNGYMLGEGQHEYGYYESEYSGIYDLYDFFGKLIIGGFTSFDYNDERGLFMFQFGGHWKQDCENYDEWGNAIYHYSYHFEKGNSRWLVLDKNLCSIVKTNNGQKHQFSKGFIGTITPKKENDRVVNYWNMPLELFSVNKPYFSHNLMICRDDDSVWSVRVTDGKASSKHDNIQVIDDDIFFFCDTYYFDNGEANKGIGIAKLFDDNQESILLTPINEDTCISICILTYPVSGYVFSVSEIDKSNYMVKLHNITTPNNPIIAIESINHRDLVDRIMEGCFLITVDEESEGYSSIMLPKIDIFNETFRSLVSKKEIVNKSLQPNHNYWFTNGLYLCEQSECDSDDYNSNYDYMSDTWDAMTDGMYGDMPNGFNGDFDFLGR